jgi:hypothetical protein
MSGAGWVFWGGCALFAFLIVAEIVDHNDW